ncbi:tail protein [Salmonella phage Mutine]|uniref:Tail spike protein n=1 Tax=Salmonella phage Mutine TaxID=2054274 RepID=A0A2H5BPC4_9CAUD|nr:tail protein [Salmonella phage Mutine]AUG88182.1 tail spike protein [Salmonella phage Mutine]
MNEMFSQGGKGSTGILTNKQAVARHFGVKQSEVVYAKSGQSLSGYKVIYDKLSQRAYALPSNIGTVTVTSLVDGILTHSEGTVDLGALAVLREEYVILIENFTSGFTIRVKNEVVSDGVSLYRWDGDSPKTVAPGSTPASTGGVGLGAWVSVGDASLRWQLASDTGYQLIPSVQIQQWKSSGDIRGWGAVCDGITDDLIPITNAIIDTSGNIAIPKTTFVSSHILFKNLSDVNVIFLNSSQIRIGTGFIFNPDYRGILEFDGCKNVTIREPNILGAKLDKLNALEPWQDGDAGIEFINCSGTLHTINPTIKDVKTWGIIHVTCTNADSIVDNPIMENCQVQSGIGGTGYRSLTINGGNLKDIGLYGVELETRSRNARTKINGTTALLCNKGFAAVNNSDNINIVNAKAINCKTGFSFYSDNSSDESLRGDNQWLKSCVATSCKTSFELVYPRNSGITGCTEDRDDIDYFTRTRALDRIVKITGGKSYVALDSPSENPGLIPGAIIQMDDGTQFTIGSVDPSASSDPLFGNVVGFTTLTVMNSAYVRSSFRRYVQISTGKTSVVLYGGNNVFIHGNDFSWSESVLSSFGNHVNLQWYDNNTYSCQNYFAQGSAGTVSGSLRVETGQNLNFGDWGSPGKFSSTIKSGITLRFDNESSHTSTIKPRYVTVEDGTLLARVRVVVDAGSTTTGSAVLKINGTDAVFLAGTPLVGESTLSPLITTAGNINVQLTDTAGDIIATGYSIKIYHLSK